MNPQQPRRRLTLADVLVIVAATALGLLVVRFVLGLGLYDQKTVGKVSPARLGIEKLSVYGVPLLVAWTSAALVLSLIHSRGQRRRLGRRPGFVACVAAMLAFDYGLVYYAAKAYSTAGQPVSLIAQHYANLTIQATHDAGLLVLGAWLAMALAGRARPGQDGMDRLGYIMGLCWVGVFLVGQFYWLCIILSSR